MPVTVVDTYIWPTIGGVITAPFSKTILNFDAGGSSDRAVVAFLRADRTVATDTFTCTYGGVSMTAGPQTSTTDAARFLQTFYLLGDGNVASGNNDLVATSSTSNCALAVCAISLCNVDSLRGGTIDYTNASSITMSDTITSESGDLALWWIYVNLGYPTYSVTGSSGTSAIDQGGDKILCVLSKTASGTTTTMNAQHSYTSSRPWGAHIMSFVPAAGSATGAPKANRMLLGVG